MVVLAVLLGPAVVGGALGWALAGWLGGVAGAAAGFALGVLATATVLTPWVTRALLAQAGVRVRGARWRGRLEVWDLRGREVTVVTGRLRRSVAVRRLDRREQPPDPPRDPPAVPGLWPLPPEQLDAPQVRRAMARIRRYRELAPAEPEPLPRRGR